MFQRVIRHIDRHFPVREMAAKMTDRRRRPHHKLDTILRCVVAMFLSRAGSVHAMGQTADSSLWRKWLKAELPGEDTVRRTMQTVAPEQLREIIRTVYTIAKRKKMLPPLGGNWQAVIFDATETSSSEFRCCDMCCIRSKKNGRARAKVPPPALWWRPEPPCRQLVAIPTP